jgi:dipeptidyl aminopeptidase/acylaminoacyl peptidase
MSKNHLLLFAASVLLSCSDHAESTTAPERQYFVSATETSSLSVISMKAFAISSGYSDLAPLLKYDVKSYRLVYKTTFKGESINVSGLLIIPQGVKTASPIISVQHGTTFVKDEAPTTGGVTGMEFFASAGYITLMPDFIGYGESSEIFHPYYDKEYSAMAVVDMIKSAKEFLNENKIDFNTDLFLAGYSEGGYVTLAAAQEIQNNAAHNLTVKAAAAGAGGYDLKGMLAGVGTTSYYSYPSYLAFVLMSYNNTYNWNKPLTYFFKPKYATALNTYLNGNYSGSYINQKLTTDLNELFDADFYSRLKQPDQELELKLAIQKNSVDGWKTNTPIRLYHGTDDEIIPFENSETTLANFKNAGSGNVSLTAVPDGTHGNSFIPMMKDVIPWFLSL